LGGCQSTGSAAAVHWGRRGVSESEECEEECEFTDGEDGEPEEFNESAFQRLLAGPRSDNAFTAVRVQRGPQPSARTQREKKAAKNLQLVAMNCQRLDGGWLKKSPRTGDESSDDRDSDPRLQAFDKQLPKHQLEVTSELQEPDKILRPKRNTLTGQNRGYSFNKLRETVPAALDSVSSTSINRYYHHCMRTMSAYRDKFHYGTREFMERVYKGHRQIVDKSKW
jgi:hypothetical protein